MRRTLILAAALCVLAACASQAPASLSSTGAWTFGFDSATGTASARQGDGGAMLTCRAPSGDMILVDYALGAAVRGSAQAQFSIGGHAINVPAQSDGRGLTVRLPRRPPNLGAYAHLSHDAVSLSAGGRTHTYAPDAVQKIAQVANACWPSGS